MRNLKKILSLALVLVMVLSMTTVANAAFTDQADITGKYTAAVEVLNGMGVFKGYEDGSFNPAGEITRAEVAALLYRIDTADVNDKKVAIYADEAQFADVPANHWAASYIGYCASTGLVNGYGDGNFGPSDKVTGYQVLAMVLRAMGYDQNGEFRGEGWELNVAQVAQGRGILNGIVSSTLGVPATRELVAQLLFTAIQKSTVIYTPALGYYTPNFLEGVDTTSLGVKNFGLKPTSVNDIWGRPSYGYSYWTGNKATLWAEEAVAKYTYAVSDCQLAVDLGLEEDATVPYWNNGDNTVATFIDVSEQTLTNGGQGVQIEVYSDRVIRIDTYLAQVGKVHPAKVDKGGHVLVEAYSDVTVYDAGLCCDVVETVMASTDFAMGTMILVNDHATKGILPVQAAAAVTGVQTVIWQNTAKHTINGTTYNDAKHFHLDQAGNTPAKAYTWYFDQFGNLIGATEIKATYTYATIANIQWINPVGSNGYAVATLVYVDGTSESVVIGSIDNVAPTYSQFNGVYTSGVTAAVSANYANNEAYIGKDLFQVSKDTNGTAYLNVIAEKISPVAVSKGNPVVVAGSVYIDDNTQFLVRTTAAGAYVYTPVTGYNQITSMKDATFFYVELGDGDAAVEYVYVYGAPLDPTANETIVYVGTVAYNYAAGTQNCTLLDAYVKGVQTPVVMDDEWFDGLYVNVEANTLYVMYDGDGNGVIDNCAGTKDNVVNVYEKDATLSNGSVVTYLSAGEYKMLANALEVAGDVVPYNTVNAVLYGAETLTGEENIVVVYKNHMISEIYVVAGPAPVV